MKKIEIWNKENKKHSFIVTIPHSGTYLPKVMRENLKDNVILANMDWYLIKLYSFLQELEITTIINNVSRYVIDQNREIIETGEQSYLKKYVYTRTTFNNDMYRKTLKDKEVNNRIQTYYNPYHKAINELIKNKLTIFDKVYLIDLHSFGKEIPNDIVLGNRNGQTASNEYTNKIKKILEKYGFNVVLNKPYSGGYITKKYASSRVETIQIELNYKKYIENREFGNEEFPIINKKLFTEAQGNLKKFFGELIKQERK